MERFTDGSCYRTLRAPSGCNVPHPLCFVVPHQKCSNMCPLWILDDFGSSQPLLGHRHLTALHDPTGNDEQILVASTMMSDRNIAEWKDGAPTECTRTVVCSL